VPDAYQARVNQVLGLSELSLGWLAALVAGMLIDAAGAATAGLAVAGLFAVVAVVGQLAQSLRQFRQEFFDMSSCLVSGARALVSLELAIFGAAPH
jgi:hypothetical protein